MLDLSIDVKLYHADDRKKLGELHETIDFKGFQAVFQRQNANNVWSTILAKKNWLRGHLKGYTIRVPFAGRVVITRVDVLAIHAKEVESGKAVVIHSVPAHGTLRVERQCHQAGFEPKFAIDDLYAKLLEEKVVERQRQDGEDSEQQCSGCQKIMCSHKIKDSEDWRAWQAMNRKHPDFESASDCARNSWFCTGPKARPARCQKRKTKSKR